MATPSGASQFWRQQVKAPARPSPTCGSTSVLQALQDRRGLARRAAGEGPEYKGKTLYDVLYANGQVNKFPLSDLQRVSTTTNPKELGYYLQKGLFEEYAEFGRGHAHDLADVRRLSQGTRPALAGGGQQGNAVGASARATTLCKEGRGARFYGKPDGKAWIFALPYQPAAEMPDAEYDLGCLPAACWSTGTPAR